MQWPRTGIPDKPDVWLTHVALRRMVDNIRSDAARTKREVRAAEAVAAEIDRGAPDHQEVEDDTLSLFFMCAHPALTTASSIALTLRALGGLTTREIAHAFLVPEATMAQRISRAKQTIRNSGLRFALPTEDERDSRLPAVLHVLYLVFNEGYTSSAGTTLLRVQLSAEAIRLTRMLHRLQQNENEVAGLLALMLLTDARRRARTGSLGELIPLNEQDRTLWNRDEIAEGTELLSQVLPQRKVGPYQVQAAIAAVHDEAASATETDWRQILVLYDLLETMLDNPIVSLNRAVAVAMVHGAAAGLKFLDALTADGRLKGHHRIDAVRAHLLELAGETPSAIESFRSAAMKTASLPERNYLLAKASRLSVDTFKLRAHG